jgi:hypothetical protein
MFSALFSTLNREDAGLSLRGICRATAEVHSSMTLDRMKRGRFPEHPVETIIRK